MKSEKIFRHQQDESLNSETEKGIKPEDQVEAKPLKNWKKAPKVTTKKLISVIWLLRFKFVKIQQAGDHLHISKSENELINEKNIFEVKEHTVDYEKQDNTKVHNDNEDKFMAETAEIDLQKHDI